MGADVCVTQQAGALAPAVSVPVVTPRLGAELAAALAASEVEAASVAEISSGHVLDAEKLRVYHVALELQVMANTLVPSIHRVVRDQFERASLSVVLNLAEGCGRVSRRQKRYHYGVARGSATECAALTDVLRLRRLAPAADCFRARSLAARCIQMTTKLIESLGSNEPKSEVVA